MANFGVKNESLRVILLFPNLTIEEKK